MLRKQKITVKATLGDKTVEVSGEKSQRNLAHLETQLNNPSKTFTPKKGKGSYKRKKRVIIDE